MERIAKHLNRFLLITIVLQQILQNLIPATASSSCQTVCACKWKGGKQTVECIDRALITIPDNIDPNTQVLDMSGNNLQILPRDTFIRNGLVNVQRVYLRNCLLGQIDEDAFKGLTNLVELDLSHNLLTGVPSTTFIHTPSLRDLTMASNPIQKIDALAFKWTHSLTKLDLSHCDIQTIAPEAFKGLTTLQSLKLNGNKLSELRPRTTETLRKLHEVELHDNPWFCDCRLRSAKIWLTQNNIPLPVAPICSGGPERVIDRTFGELVIDDFACRPEMLPVSRFVVATSSDNATIICRTSAVPSPQISWFLHGRALINGSAFSSYQRVYVFEDGEFEKRSQLVLTNAQESDSNEYYCVAENRAGNAEANFTLLVQMRTAASLGSGQIVGLSAALVILILFILLIIMFLLVRLRRQPFNETKTPGHLEVITAAVTQSTTNGKSCSTTGGNDNSLLSIERKAPSDLKLTNPVQKPPRLTDLNYSTSNYEGNGSIISGGPFVSPTASSCNNPDLINDTKRFGSGELATLVGDTLTIIERDTGIERPGSGDYSRAGYDSLYPSGLWEQQQQKKNSNSSQSIPVGSSIDPADVFLKRAISTTIPSGGSSYSYTEKTPIITSMVGGGGGSSSNSTTAMSDEDITNSRTHQIEFISRTFPRTSIAHQLLPTNTFANNSNSTDSSGGGYPSDYGLPIVPGAEQQQSFTIRSKESIPPPSGMPTNAKTLRVWQRGGVPVLPPVTALKRAFTNSRNSPDEGYQEGCGTDV